MWTWRSHSQCAGNAGRGINDGMARFNVLSPIAASRGAAEGKGATFATAYACDVEGWHFYTGQKSGMQDWPKQFG